MSVEEDGVAILERHSLNDGGRWGGVSDIIGEEEASILVEDLGLEEFDIVVGLIGLESDSREEEVESRVEFEVLEILAMIALFPESDSLG